MKKFAKLLSTTALLLVSAILAGCASPAMPSNMTVRTADSTDARTKSPEWAKNAIAVKDVTGGRETNPAWTSNVSSSAFRIALEDSLKAVGLAATNGPAKYDLVAHLAKLDQPFGGFNMTVTATVNYQLIDRTSQKTVWEHILVTPYTASVSDAFVGSQRLQMANEGAIRTNVTQLVQRIQALSATAVSVR